MQVALSTALKHYDQFEVSEITQTSQILKKTPLLWSLSSVERLELVKKKKKKYLFFLFTCLRVIISRSMGRIEFLQWMLYKEIWYM